MLCPLRGRIRQRKFVTYDLEWIPGTQPARAKREGFSPDELRLVGTFDGKRYRAYKSIKDFLNGELTRSRRDYWFYAHSGGRHDIQFVFDYLINHSSKNIQISAFFTASSAVIVRIDKGRDKWFFVDSFFLIRQSLREIGKWIGMSKGGAEDSIDVFYAPYEELKTYNEKDCRILWHAINSFQKTVNDLGGQLRFTLAATAMDLFRRNYLHRTIKTISLINNASKNAYIASRVEVFQKYVKNGDYYDINSSFPYAMTQASPGEFEHFGRIKPDSGIYIADATIDIGPCVLPPVPFRSPANRVYFPIGKWRSWFSNVDLELLEDTGHKIETIHKCISFKPFYDLKDYAQTIYEIRKNSEDDAEKVVLKLLLNSLYGKFAESEIKTRFVINPNASFFKKNSPRIEGEDLGYSLVMPGVYGVNERKQIPHAHVPIAMHITALARRSLYNYMSAAPDVYYCDTDGFCVPNTFSYPTSSELGDLKLEKPVYEAKFEAPKLYAYTEDGEDWKIKAKGFPRVRGTRLSDGSWYVSENDEERKLSIKDFDDLISHKELQIDRWIGVRQAFRSGDTKPRTVSTLKTYRGKVLPKRRFASDGSSVPWDIGEILELE